MKKEKNKRKLSKLPNCLSKKKANNNQKQKSVLQVKGKNLYFPQKYMKSYKICLKYDIKTALLFENLKIRQKLYY